jgi:purine-nucleoside phosphorylase
MNHIFIHSAFFAEAKTIIEFYKLQCIQTKPYKIYHKEHIILIITGIGKEKTSLYVNDILNKYDIVKAINIGIAGCKDKNIEIGSLFCTNHKLSFVDYADITTVDEPLDNSENLKTTLVDMEAEYFISTCKEFLDIKDIYILKVVSDHLNTTIPKKEFVWKIIEKNLKSISKVVTLQN